VIGNRVTIKNGVHVWDGVSIGDDVFVGPNVSFTNDRHPRSKQHVVASTTEVQDNSSIGAGAVILPGIVIGRGAIVGAGAVVTKSVPPNGVVVGNPARLIGHAGSKSVNQGSAPNPESKTDLVPISTVRLIALASLVDERGKLAVAEFPSSLPFEPKRFFMISEVPADVVRGQHAHIQCSQFLVATAGSLKIMIEADGVREEFLLNNPEVGLLIPPMNWAVQFSYSEDCVLLVLASHTYEEADYVRDYDTFLALEVAK